MLFWPTMDAVVKHLETSHGQKMLSANYFEATRGRKVMLRCQCCGKPLASAYVAGTQVRFPATLGLLEISNFDENEDGTYTYRCSRSNCEAPPFRIPAMTVAKQAQSAAESGIRSIRIGPQSVIHP
jgi:hypothetical protein